MESLWIRQLWRTLWPGAWVPALILVAGLVATGIAARIEANQARIMAEAHYHAQHQALVNLLLARAPSLAIGSGSGSIDEQAASWLQALYQDAVPPGIGLRIDTLQRHTKRPLLQIRTGHSLDPTLTLRTEINPGNANWMLTTVPSPAGLEHAARNARTTVWLIGAALCLSATLLTGLLCRRLHIKSLQIQELEARAQSDHDQIKNLQVEKAVLRRVLNDSEERSRDLVVLSGATIFELDEAGLIGFISPQVADLLDRAPTDLAGEPLESLVEPAYLDNYRRALGAAQAEQSVQRIDLTLLHRDHERRVPVIMRISALKDPLHGLAGFRITAQQDASASPV